MDVALLVHTANEWSRKVLKGVAQYGDDQGGWEFLIPPANGTGEVSLPRNWNGDGIICRLTSKRLENEIIARNIPCVNVSWLGQHRPALPKVVSNQRKCADLAVDFLLEKQFDHFGYVGFHPELNYSTIIESTISERITREGKSLEIFPFPAKTKNVKGLELEPLCKWLEQLEKPTAVIAWSSASGQVITRACHLSNLRVPDNVAILCIEHDDLFSSLAPIPLTNLDQDPWRVGYSAAKLLHNIKNGVTPSDEEIQIPPISVVPRLSTDATAVSDPILSTAVRYIYENAKQGIVVSDVIKHVGISRRALETRFKNQLHCSPGAYIRKIQLQLVARLLRTTKLTITEIAFRTGFEYPEVMMRAFKKEHGVTPMGFRFADSSSEK